MSRITRCENCDADLLRITDDRWIEHAYGLVFCDAECLAEFDARLEADQ